MNVLMLSHLFPNQRDASAGIFVLEQARRLRELDVKITTLAPTPWAPACLERVPAIRKRTGIASHELIDGIPVDRPAVFTPPRKIAFSALGIFYYLGCRSAFARHLQEQRLDLIHAHTILPDGLAAALLGREFRVPTVCTLHGSDINVYPHESWANYRMTSWTLRHIDRLIAVSEDLKRNAQAIADVGEVVVARNGADESLFHPIPAAQARKTLKLPPDKKIICYVGYLRPEKSLDCLLAAFSRLSCDAILCIVGDGPLKSELMSRAQSLGIQEKCRFVGYQPHSAVPLWLSASNCLVLCSTTEGLPTILPEAMLCRVPIVTTTPGGISEIVQDGKTACTVPHSNPVALADAVRSILIDDNLAESLTSQAYAFARETLTWKANAEVIMTVYKDASRRTGSALRRAA